MGTILYFVDTPKFIKGTLPSDTQFPSFTVQGNGIRQNSSSTPRSLSTTPGIISSNIYGAEFATSGIPATGDATSYFRMFVSDPVVAGFYVPGPIRLYGTMAQTNINTDVDSFFRIVTYFWRPSTGAIVSGTGVAATNYQMQTVIDLDPETDGSSDKIARSLDSPSLGPEYGWSVQTGDVFIVEVAVRWLSTLVTAKTFTYQLWFGGTGQPNASPAKNGSNPTAFIQLPFDLQFVQSTQTPVKPTLFRDMFALVGS